MKLIGKMLCLLIFVITAICIGIAAAEHQSLTDGLVRLHVIADSDSPVDQSIKLKVRDAVLDIVAAATQGVQDKEKAMDIMGGMLDQIEEAANDVLKINGFSETAKVELGRESYPVREYDTFSLPSGVYDSLRITIGSGEGKNWWCVVFPNLCMPAAGMEVKDVAAAAGLSEPVTDTLTSGGQYEIRFFLLDCIGRLEKFFYDLSK